MANVSFRPFLLSDLMALDVQDIHQPAKDCALGSIYVMQSMAQCEEAFTMLVDGKVMACCGQTRGELWAFLGKDLKRSMVALTRYGMHKIREFGPVRAWVDAKNKAAIRWVALAGFNPIGNGYWEYA